MTTFMQRNLTTMTQSQVFLRRLPEFTHFNSGFHILEVSFATSNIPSQRNHHHTKVFLLALAQQDPAAFAHSQNLHFHDFALLAVTSSVMQAFSQTANGPPHTMDITP